MRSLERQSVVPRERLNHSAEKMTLITVPLLVWWKLFSAKWSFLCRRNDSRMAVCLKNVLVGSLPVSCGDIPMHGKIGSCREKPYSPNSPLCFYLIKHVLWVLCVRLPICTCASFAYVNCNTGLALLLCTSQKIGLRRHILNQLLKPAWKSQKFLTKFKTINQLCSNPIE